MGGAANDQLRGRLGNDILLGQNGADVLTAGAGRDVAIGGLGTDDLRGGDEQDILIGGSTAYDDSVNRRALELILLAWLAERDYLERVDQLRLIGIEDGDDIYRLTPLDTVFADAMADSLDGGDDRDWFLVDPADLVSPDANERVSTS